jgi:hypothetical protein
LAATCTDVRSLELVELADPSTPADAPASAVQASDELPAIRHDNMTASVRPRVFLLSLFSWLQAMIESSIGLLVLGGRSGGTLYSSAVEIIGRTSLGSLMTN